MSSEHIQDVAEASFTANVIEQSHEVPVLVDFWAPWCGPCRMLGPVLEKLAVEMNGAFILAKVNSDEAQRVAMEYQVSGIPAVKLFVGGKVVADFMGVLPESQVREFLAQHLPNEARSTLAEGKRLLAQGKRGDAMEAFQNAIELDGSLSEARVALAALMLEDGESAAAEQLLASIGAHDEERDRADALLQLIDFSTGCANAGGLESSLKKAEKEGDTAENAFERGQCLAASGRFEEALEALLLSVSIDKKHADEAARKAMLTIFQIVGIRSDLANGFRRRLSIYL